jgi:hypothetical protein
VVEQANRTWSGSAGAGALGMSTEQACRPTLALALNGRSFIGKLSASYGLTAAIAVVQVACAYH